MEKIQQTLFSRHLYSKKDHFPLKGLIELTYRCNLNCLHCYCNGLEDNNRELTTAEWQKIIDILKDEGCLFLYISGGEPLVRSDFLEIYNYAKSRGFIITLLTNGYALNKKMVECLAKSPPRSIEITLNGITKATYESITRKNGSFTEVIHNIKLLKEKKFHLILKTKCLKQNKDELSKIKDWSEANRFKFGYGSLLHPRLNSDKTPLNFRLSIPDMLKMRRKSRNMRNEYCNGLHNKVLNLRRNKKFLYHCSSWSKEFIIDPYGRLRFCLLSSKFSVDLKTTSFKEGFYNVFPRVLKEEFKTNSKCKNCKLRPFCYYCPARAYLETGNEEGPIEYYCELTKKIAKQ